MVSANDAFPTEVQLPYIPYTKENESITACANPLKLNLEKFADKVVVITAAPGAFTGTCTEQHVPDFTKHEADFKSKGVDKVVILTANDPFVNAAWAKALGHKDESNYFTFASDPNASLSKSLGTTFVADLTAVGFGVRTARWSAIIDHGKVKYISTSGGTDYTKDINVDTILSHL